VADAQNVDITAQYGAITSSTQTTSRSADVQVRSARPRRTTRTARTALSALTTMPLPLTDDRAAIERSLWFATNRGYGKALDATWRR
jgi:TldD protein